MPPDAPAPAGRRHVLALLAGIAVVFGLATLVAGGRVLAGADPGYVVYRPLLLFNTGMGLAYVAAGVVAWRQPRSGRRAAGLVFVLNAIVLAGIAWLYVAGGAVAADSLRAMTLRTVVWLVLFLALRRYVAAPGPSRLAGRP